MESCSGGLKKSGSKTEHLCINPEEDENNLKLDGNNIKNVDCFRYLGSIIDKSGNLEKEVNSRIQAGWRNWKEVTGVLCDRKIPVRLKGKVYMTVVRPALKYATETLALNKTNVGRMKVAKMKMLRWMCRVTRMDRIQNEHIQGTVKVADVAEKIQEAMLRWYGHIVRREENYVGKKVLKMELEGKRKRGRPKKRWMELIREDLTKKNLDEELAKDRKN